MKLLVPILLNCIFVTLFYLLDKKTAFKKYRLKTGTVPNAVEYTYTYKVNGKLYHLRGVQHTHSRNLRKRVTIVYLRSFPRRAYEEHFSGIVEWLIAVSFSTMGVSLIMLYFLAG